MSETVEIRRDLLLHGLYLRSWDTQGQCPACSVGQYVQQRPDYPLQGTRTERVNYLTTVLVSLKERENAREDLDAIKLYNDELLRQRVVLKKPDTTPSYESLIVKHFAKLGVTATFTGEYLT